MATMNFSSFQKAIFAEVKNGKTNIAVNAVAGSGKTTTIVECCKLLGYRNKYDVKFLAFNRSIVKELGEKISRYADVSTLHSFGLSIIRNVLGDRGFEVDKNDRKYSRIVRDNNMLTLNNDDSNYQKALNNIDKLMKLCRINLIGDDIAAVNAICDEYSIVPLANEVSLACEFLKDAYSVKSDGNRKPLIDYTDMIVLPLSEKFVDKIPTYKVVFVDECQDLSKAQRELMLAAARNGRFVAVGDRRQAINGFAGADCASFDKIATLPNTIELPLSVNYRCGKNIISMAQEVVPEIQACETAIDGVVNNVNKITLDLFKPNDMVLCRTAAPLVVMCLKLIAAGVTAVVKGKDIASGLIGMIDKSKAKTIKGFESWCEIEKEKKAREIAKRDKCTLSEAKETGTFVGFCDRINCILAVGENISNLDGVKAKIEEIFSDERKANAVNFSTCHKSKGLEADRVLILLPNKLPLTWKNQKDWEFEQEMNLKYVALTRAKKELVFVNVEQNELFATDFTR